MKTNAIIRIIVWSLVLVLSLGALLFALEWDRGADPMESVKAEETTFPIERPSEFGYSEKLKIDWPCGTITIQPGDVHTIEVKETPVSDQKYAMVCTQEEDTLHIRYQESSASLSIGKSLEKDLNVTVPWEWYGTSLKVETASANMTVRDLSISLVSVAGVSAESTFENCTVEDLSFITTSGNLNFGGRLGKLKADSVSADITAELLNVPESIALTSTSGSLLLTLPQNAGFDAKVHTTSGTFTSDFETSQEDNHYLCGDSSCKIDAATTSGSVSIRKG